MWNGLIAHNNIEDLSRIMLNSQYNNKNNFNTVSVNKYLLKIIILN